VPRILSLLSLVVLHTPAWAAAGSALELRAIVFSGNRGVAASALREALPLKVGAKLPALMLGDEMVEAFTERAIVEPLRRLYADRGYVEHQVKREAVRFVVDDDGVSIHVPIVEGQRFAIGRFSVDGERPRTSLELGRELGIVRGRPFSGTSVVQAMELLATPLRNQGHATAEVTPRLKLDRKRRVVDVHLTVDRGAVCYVERVLVRGNDRVRSATLLRALTFGEGDRFSEAALERTRNKLLERGLFEAVDVVVSGGTTDDQLVITVEVKERADCPHTDAA